MQTVFRLLGIVVLTVFLTGCNTVNYDPTSHSDGTAPTVNLLIQRAGQPDLQVDDRILQPTTVGSYGNNIANNRFEFKILATGTDNESGIKAVKLFVTRTVCYTSSGGASAAYYTGTMLVKEFDNTDPHNAPTQSFLQFTGVIDDTQNAVANPTTDNLLTWVNINNTPAVGKGVSTYWTMEADNFAGAKTTSDRIFITAGDLSCPIGP